MFVRYLCLRIGFLWLSFCIVASAQENPLWTAVKNVPAQPSQHDNENGFAYSERINSLRRAALVEYIEGTNGQTGLLSAHLESGELTIESHRVLRNGIATPGQQELAVHNIVLKLGSEIKPTIVVAAHLDKVVETGTGVIDDWSGCTMVLNACHSLAENDELLNHNFIFVCFAYEESNLWGSKTFVNDLKLGDTLLTPMLGGLHNIKAMINLECLGVSDLYGWKEGSTESLAVEAQSVANLLGLNFENRLIGLPVGADSVPFFFEGIPSITIDSLKAPAFPGDTNHDFGKIHSSEDKLSSMNEAKYLTTLDFVTTYLQRLDQALVSSGFQAGYQQLRVAQPTKEEHPMVKYISFGHGLHSQMNRVQPSARLQFDTSRETLSLAVSIPASGFSLPKQDAIESVCRNSCVVQLGKGVFAFQEHGNWVFVAVKDGKAKRTALRNLPESTETDMFP